MLYPIGYNKRVGEKFGLAQEGKYKMSIACLACGQAISPPEHTKCHGLHEDCFLRIFELKKWDDFHGVVMKYGISSDPLEPKKTNSGTMESHSHSFPESFFHGKFKKYQVELAGRKYIFKQQDLNSINKMKP